MMYLEIEKVIGREIIDSRGNPTVEAEVYLTDGTMGREQHQAELLLESSKRWSYVTRIRAVLVEKACPRQLKISIPSFLTYYVEWIRPTSMPLIRL